MKNLDSSLTCESSFAICLAMDYSLLEFGNLTDVACILTGWGTAFGVSALGSFFRWFKGSIENRSSMSDFQ